jgi:hypothetical protein
LEKNGFCIRTSISGRSFWRSNHCQKIPIRSILAMAPHKYPWVRDFEARAIKRLISFTNAKQDIDPQLLLPVTRGQVKDDFIKQSRDSANNLLT